MKTENIPTFMLLALGHDESDSTGHTLLNLNQVCMINEITTDSLKLIFSREFTVTIHGEKTVAELLAALAGNAIIHDGRPLIEALGFDR